MDIKKKRVQILLFIVGVTLLSITAEKCRTLAGEMKESLSRAGQFSVFDCFDMGSGSIACAVKEGVHLYVHNIRGALVEKKKNVAMVKAMEDAMSQGMSPKDAAKEVKRAGKKAAKLAIRQSESVIGPILSSGWDFFESVYYGGTMTEGFCRGKGTLFGTYCGGLFGEQLLGRLGHLVGSQFGGWVGGRIGLMIYDVVNGVHYLLRFIRGEETDGNLYV